jgi:hypothetical protein
VILKKMTITAEIIFVVIIRRKLHNEELRDLYSSPSIIRMTKSRRMKWVGHVAQMGERESHIGCC